MVQTIQIAEKKTTSRQKISYDEFLASPLFDEGFAEWVDGEVITMVPPSTLHQRVSEFLSTLLVLFNEIHAKGEVLIAPYQMKLEKVRRGREPDILFIARKRLDRIKKNYLDGPADLAVEVISRESRTRDRREKFYEYEKGGVREFWLIDPERRKAEFYHLSTDGTYNPIPIGADGVFHSVVLEGFWIKVPWLWQDPLPPRLGILKEWKLI